MEMAHLFKELSFHLLEVRREDLATEIPSILLIIDVYQSEVQPEVLGYGDYVELVLQSQNLFGNDPSLSDL